MKSINFIFGCHSHQPVGNFHHVFEEAYEKSYKPFIDVLEQFPSVRTVLHYTGPLWDWFLEHRPEYMHRLRALVQTGQVEIMGGAYYEPLLSAIPQRDAIAQIRRMQAFCQEQFGQKPRGMWLAERVWEPQMARTLAEAGVEYTVLDDMHFKASGLRPHELHGYYMTEDEGRSVKVFPIQEKLRYTVPFRPVHEAIDYLRSVASEDGMRCAVLHDDGEKFGVWPGTYQSVFEEGWLREFFQAITDNQEWLHSVTYADFMAKAKSLGRTYITCASYQEMMGWALPARMQRQYEDLRHDYPEDSEIQLYIRGGFWRNFLAKYPEANSMQKRMLLESNRLDKLKKTHAENGRLVTAEKLLHEGQCNCAYWHGVFGGLYLNHLRTAVYEKVIEAGRELDAIERGEGSWSNSHVQDFDSDGYDEILLENEHTAVFVKPAEGGSIYEWDFKPRPFNLLNTLARREEFYHAKLHGGEAQMAGEGGDSGQSIHDLVWVKEKDLEKYLVYDPYRRSSLRDHFYGEDLTAERLWSSEAQDLGSFADEEYVPELSDGALTLTRYGIVDQGESCAVRVQKHVRLLPGASALEIRYDIENTGAQAFACLFGVEFAVNFLSGSGPDRYYFSEDRDLAYLPLGSTGVQEDLRHIALRDNWLQLSCHLRFSDGARVFHYPLETVSQSEGGQERVYQGSVVMPGWRIECAPGQSWTRTIEARVDHG